VRSESRNSEGPEAELGLEAGPLGARQGDAGLEEGDSLVERDGRDLVVGEVESPDGVVAAE
jgi:hypothetical protein